VNGAPVIAGLAIGIAFIAVFTIVFGTTKPITERKFGVDISIIGLKDEYARGEGIEITINAKGFVDSICGNDYPNVVIVKELENEIAFDLTVDNYLAVCGSEPESINKSWHYGNIDPYEIAYPDHENISNSTPIFVPDIGSQPIELEAAGIYKLLVSFKNATIVKEFNVTQTPISPDIPREVTPVPPLLNCLENSLCSYDLTLPDNHAYTINYRFNGMIESMSANQATSTLLINVKAEKLERLLIAIPRDLIDSSQGADGKSGFDQDFAVFVDAKNVDANEYTSKDAKWAKALGITDNPEKYRILQIEVEDGAETVEIVATMAL